MLFQPSIQLVFGGFLKAKYVHTLVKAFDKCRRLFCRTEINSVFICGEGYYRVGVFLTDCDKLLERFKTALFKRGKICVTPFYKLKIAHHRRCLNRLDYGGKINILSVKDGVVEYGKRFVGQYLLSQSLKIISYEIILLSCEKIYTTEIAVFQIHFEACDIHIFILAFLSAPPMVIPYTRSISPPSLLRLILTRFAVTVDSN